MHTIFFSQKLMQAPHNYEVCEMKITKLVAIKHKWPKNK